MNRSIIIGAILIGISVIATPFIYDFVKQKERQEVAYQTEIVDINALEQFAEEYKKIKGHCPQKASDMLNVVIRREPKDRYGVEFETSGDCKFKSIEGTTSDSI